MGPINSMVAGTRAGPNGECHKSVSVKVRQSERGDRQRAESLAGGFVLSTISTCTVRRCAGRKGHDGLVWGP